MMLDFPTNSWYTFKKTGDNTAQITGYKHNGNVFIGAKTKTVTNDVWAVTEVETRNHAGVFNNPANAINSFYTATIERLR
jgi:hypothetical protein